MLPNEQFDEDIARINRSYLIVLREYLRVNGAAATMVRFDISPQDIEWLETLDLTQLDRIGSSATPIIKPKLKLSTLNTLSEEQGRWLLELAAN